MTTGLTSSAMAASVVSLPSSDQLPSNPNGNPATNANLNENNFFQLLTAQLENQDPLNPLKASDFAAELAQFSTAIGVQQLQNSQQSYNNLQLSGLVGRNVAVSGNSLILGKNGAATGAINLASAASDVVVSITDSSGQLVQSLDLGPQSSGVTTFSWDGTQSDGSTASPGTYQIKVGAVGPSGSAITATPYAVAPVTGVTLGGANGPTIDLGGGLAPVALTGIYQVL